MVYRVFVEKKPTLAAEAHALRNELTTLFGIEGLKDLRLFNRYDVEGIGEELFRASVRAVFSEPQLDDVYNELPGGADEVFAVEYLPGQFDQRADSAAQCIQLLSQGERPTVRTAKVYLLYGKLSEDALRTVQKYVINPVESRLASMEKPETLETAYALPTEVATVRGFCDFTDEELLAYLQKAGLAMDEGDIRFCQSYFRKEGRDPTVTEIKMIDTYWSDHCRHTTFSTTIDRVEFADPVLERAYQTYLSTREKLGRTKPINLMDIATLAGKALRAEGKLDKLDESEEINACTVKIKVQIDGKDEDWLLLFKNETHNHPTEIEPFGGAATCIGGAIRDPLSGRAYVYAAMRVTGAGDPLVPVRETLPGKLPQRKIVTTAAAGYSSYGNQIGLATGMVDELYHEGYVAKRMEIGAVIAAAPAENVRRERPEPGDVVILLGGRTGRDGCGGATGSSKSHTLQSLETCGAEVQKGNAPEERKLQRLFRNPEASRLIKRCNDFGAGGVSVAIGELADGLSIDLNKVPKKYEGLDGTELAISESQERMAVVVAKEDAERFRELAYAENLEASEVAVVTEEKRLRMEWNEKAIVDISREFLNSNGAEKHIVIQTQKPLPYDRPIPADFADGMRALAGDLNVCSRRGLSERFDSTIGAGTVLMPFGGKYQLTPIQTMVHTVSTEKRETSTCSLMSWGYNPRLSEKSPYHGAYQAVVESVTKLIAAGSDFQDIYLTFQEYFSKPGRDGKRWGQPFEALLGAFMAQMNLGVAAIGGKDSMSGSFEQIDVPPTLCSFAVTTEDASHILSPEFKGAGHPVVLFRPETDADGLPETESLLAVYRTFTALARAGKVLSAYTPTFGGVAEAVMKMGFGNGFGFAFDDGVSPETVFGPSCGWLLAECTELPESGTLLGYTTAEKAVSYRASRVSQEELLSLYEGKLEPVFACNIPQGKPGESLPTFTYHAKNAPASTHIGGAKPRVLIPVFPGTNCEYDTAKALARAGAEPEIVVLNNLSAKSVAESVAYFARRVGDSQMVFLPGGFSGGDEPDGSGKFITAFFRASAVKDAVHTLLKQRDGLVGGICNGFQALIKLGLVPFGEIRDPDPDSPTLTFNTIGRHQSRLVRTRVCSDLSPWLRNATVGEVYIVPISHGEGRFYASAEWVKRLSENGQIATQYVDLDGNPTSDVRFNPNDSVCAIEGITSPDGRVFGKMGHAERVGKNLYRNVPGNYDIGMFDAAVSYFR